MELKNKVVVITGASDGLGRSLAIRLAKAGAKIALVSRSETKLNEVKKVIGAFAEYFVCDIGQPDQVETTVKAVVKKFKTIDILVNNAGIWLQGSTEAIEPDKISAVFQANVLGLVYMTRAVLPLLKKRPEAIIFNVISNSGLEPSGDWGIYVGSKFAARGFSESLRLELSGTKVKVMAFYPGGMDTDLFVKAGVDKRHEPWMMKKDDVTEIIEFMLTRPKDITIHAVEVTKA
jgi:NADP-dependent 3-hydroxy acid dehydrogenase YdfG